MCRSGSVGCYLPKGFVPPITAGEISDIQRHYVRTLYVWVKRFGESRGGFP